MKAHAWLALVGLAAFAACTGQDEIGTGSEALTVKSQLRGYDLGPPFPAGFRDSGLVNGYGENEWVPFVAVMEGKKLEDADGLAGGIGDGRYGASIIVPSYSSKHGANAIVDLQVTGTYGEGALTPIPDPFDDHWLEANDYAPFVLGAFAETGDIDTAPRLGDIAQKLGPTRFGGEVGSASIPVEFQAPAGSGAVELHFAVRLARRGLDKVAPDGQAFPGTRDGTALGAADFFPGPGPIFVGYDVGDPTGIATVPIRVVRHSCQSDDECPPGRYCGETGTCVEPCVNDSNCADDEICEDGACEAAPPLCNSNGDCEVGDYCVGGYCLPPCPPEGNDDCTGNDDVDDGCDAEACCGGYHDESPPCVRDSQCEDGYLCDDGVCEPPDTPCDVSCPEGEVCIDGTCEPPGNPCVEDSECPGGQVCVYGNCHEGEPPCVGEDCPPCTWDADCPGGELCLDGTCHPANPPDVCENNGDCPANQICEGGFCDGKETCDDDSDCPNGSACDNTVDLCVPEHPPIPCDDSGDCPAGDTCTSGTCTPPDTCQDDDDCYGDSVCYDNGGVELCVPPHPPIPCEGDGDCPSGDVCEAGFCESDDDGDGDGDAPPGEECDNDLDCPSGECVDNGGVELCVPPHDPIPCDGESDCPAGDQCAGGFCTSDNCEDSGDCPAGTVCADNGGVELCVPEHPPVPCDADDDCPGGDLCEAGFCAPQEECDDDTDCPGGEVCVDNGGVEICVPGQPPVPCDTPADCPAPDNCGLDDVGDCEAVCMGGYCLPGGDGGGGACSSDGQCPGGYVCAGGHCAPADDPVACDSQYDCGGNLCTGGFCQPGGDVVTCETAQDCYGNDDVGNETCVDGVCYDNSVDLRLCSASTICPAGYQCSGGLCNRSEGACELDADCSDGQGCIDGWCGQLCDDSCSGTCAAGRCVATCGTYSDCEIGEACFTGGCVPKYALVARDGGDPQLWVVALPGSGNVSGGCSAGGGSGGGAGVLLLVAAAVLGLGRRRRRAR